MSHEVLNSNCNRFCIDSCLFRPQTFQLQNLLRWPSKRAAKRALARALSAAYESNVLLRWLQDCDQTWRASPLDRSCRSDRLPTCRSQQQVDARCCVRCGEDLVTMQQLSRLHSSHRVVSYHGERRTAHVCMQVQACSALAWHGQPWAAGVVGILV